MREEIIKLHNEVERGPDKDTWEKVEDMRRELDSRLAELGAVLQDLGTAQYKPKKEAAARRKPANATSPKESTNQRQWRNTTTISDLTGEIVARLPSILEEHQLSQRTAK